MTLSSRGPSSAMAHLISASTAARLRAVAGRGRRQQVLVLTLNRESGRDQCEAKNREHRCRGQKREAVQQAHGAENVAHGRLGAKSLAESAVVSPCKPSGRAAPANRGSRSRRLLRSLPPPFPRSSPHPRIQIERTAPSHSRARRRVCARNRIADFRKGFPATTQLESQLLCLLTESTRFSD